MTELQKYRDSLKHHPGVPVAILCQFLGFLAGTTGEHWFLNGLIGAGIMSFYWIPVLWTAWTMVR